MPDSLTLPRPRRREASAAAPARRPFRPAPPERGSRSATLCLIGICALVLGIWLPASHHALGYPFVEGAEDAFFTETLVGVLVGCAGYGRLQSSLHLPKLTALQAAAGAWLVAAPWLLGYAREVPAARVNDVVCGAAAVLLAAAAAVVSHRDRGLAEPLRATGRQAGEPLAEPGVSPGDSRKPYDRRPAHAGAG